MGSTQQRKAVAQVPYIKLRTINIEGVYAIQGLAYSPDGRLLAASGSGDGKYSRLRVLDAETDRPLPGFHTEEDGFHLMSFSHDSQMLATATGSGTTPGVQIWDLKSGVRRRTLPTTWAADALSCSTRNRMIAVASLSSILISNADDGGLVSELNAGTNGPGADAIRFINGDNQVLVAYPDDGIWRWDVATRQVTKLLATSSGFGRGVYPLRLVGMAGSDLFAVTAKSSSPVGEHLRFIDAATGKSRLCESIYTSDATAAMHPSGKLVATLQVGDRGFNDLIVVSTVNCSIVQRITPRLTIHSMDFNLDGKLAVSGYAGHQEPAATQIEIWGNI